MFTRAAESTKAGKRSISLHTVRGYRPALEELECRTAPVVAGQLGAGVAGIEQFTGVVMLTRVVVRSPDRAT